MTRKGSDYVQAPDIPENYLALYELAMSASYGALPVTEAARRAGLSRVRFQTLMHRAQRAFAEALMQKAPGRPATPAEVAELKAQVKALTKENTALHKELAMAEELFSTAGEMMRHLRRPRSARAAKPGEARPKPDEEPEPATAREASATPATLPRWRRCSRRWRARLNRMTDVVRTGGRPPRSPAPPEVEARIEDLVRETHGQIGAEALRRAVGGVSRRQAAAVKADVVTDLERERKARCGTVVVAQAGVVRGFDQMYVWTTEGWRYLLVCADAAIPYRTTIDVVEHYDAPSVAETLQRDVEAYGAPLAYRLDRAACHAADAVQAVLDAAGALVLQGPPHHPWYYGQLERQNREHRAWLAALGTPTPAQLAAAVGRMRHALNALWPRRTLGWQTSEALWNQRAPLIEDREALQREVRERSLRLVHDGTPADLARRWSVEHALRLRAYLEVKPGGWC